MGARKLAFRQADIERALKAAKAVGMEIGRVEIDQTGKIVIVSGEAEPVKEVDHLAAWKAARYANRA